MNYPYMFDIGEARDILRIDGRDNDEIIYNLMEALPDYLEETTGYRPSKRRGYSPVAKTAGRFILQLWYYGESSDTAKLQRVIDCLLKALSTERGAV